MKTLAGIAMTITMIVGGCVHDNGGVEGIDDIDVSAKTSSTYAVVIGMEYSKFAGSCPGAKLDSNRMYSLLSKYTQNCVLLQDEKATRSNVRSAIENGISKSENGLFILYYSGHGGSDPFPDTGIEEKDGKDEYLCLYDVYMRDNEIWSLISKSKGRVVLLADCCHSRTVWKSPKFTLANAIPLGASYNEEGPISMQCWSGCPDNTYSYGSETGGQFTNALLRHFNASMTYDELWNKIEQDSTLKRYEIVQRTLMGADFRNVKVFR